jgi:hypothetical protein
MKEDIGTYLADAVNQFLGTHQAFRQLWMQKESMKLQKEQLAIEKKKADWEREKAIWEIGPMMAAIAGQPVSIPEVGKVLQVDTSQYPTSKKQEKKEVTPTGPAPAGTKIEATVTREEPFYFKPQEQMAVGGVKPIDPMTAQYMNQTTYNNVDPDMIVLSSKQWAQDPKATMKDYTDFLGELDKMQGATGDKLPMPQITWDEASRMRNTEFPHVDETFILLASAQLTAAQAAGGEGGGVQAWSNFYKVLLDAEQQAIARLNAGKDPNFDQTKYALDVQSKNLSNALKGIGKGEFMGELTGTDKANLDKMYNQLNANSIGLLERDETMDPDVKADIIKFLKKSTPSAWASGLIGVGNEADTAFANQKKEKDYQAFVLDFVRKRGYPFYSWSMFSKAIDDAEKYLTGK